MPHKSNGLTLVNGEGNVIQNRMFAIIRETYMFKPDIAFFDFSLPIFLKGLIGPLVDQSKTRPAETIDVCRVEKFCVTSIKGSKRRLMYWIKAYMVPAVIPR